MEEDLNHVASAICELAANISALPTMFVGDTIGAGHIAPA
jgi:hypothetical protein